MSENKRSEVAKQFKEWFDKEGIPHIELKDAEPIRMRRCG